MVTRLFFEHESPENTTPRDRIEATGYGPDWSGENLFYGYGETIGTAPGVGYGEEPELDPTSPGGFSEGTEGGQEPDRSITPDIPIAHTKPTKAEKRKKMLKQCLRKARKNKKKPKRCRRRYG